MRAFTKLGLADLNDLPSDLRSPKHLLTPGQYRAFRGLLAAEVRQQAAAFELDMLLGSGEALQEGLLARLEEFFEAQGISIEQVEIHSVAPTDKSLLSDLSVEKEQHLHEGAEKTRITTTERLARERVASAARLAEAEIAERAIREAAELEASRKQRLSQESADLEVTHSRLAREQVEHETRLQRERERATAQRDVIDSITEAEARKPQALREAETLRLFAEKGAEALASLPLQDARWITIGQEGPWKTIASLLKPLQTSSSPSGVGSTWP